MEFTQEQAKKLYEFWFDHSENLCSCCKDYVECAEEKCPNYKVYGTRTNFFGQEEVMTCMNLDFGTCEFLKDKPCGKCAEGFYIEDFNWNGEVK